ncbi:MAG: hypothetical protein JG774_1829 [Desulfomicrobiaceae bacterium]|nr:hypothetical protein [Desulfomicrobiaceae bacterium]MBZ4686084.1 hypothetical protein [Desulfomicrobiaceae bacterium]MDI3493130.1 hypothetical protein [Desulfomicrobiaceae bacterium]
MRRLFSMELMFVCPECGEVFSQSTWSIEERLQVEETEIEGRVVRGLVRVHCPLCGKVHRYTPDAVLCPVISRPEHGI